MNRVVGANTFGFKFTNHHVVRAVLERIQPNKAQGYDYIPPRAVKALSLAIAQPLSDLRCLHRVLRARAPMMRALVM